MAKILIVDDYPTNREFLISLLRHQHHQLLEAADGQEALALTQAEHPDLVITDVLMPRMDGYEFLRSLRSDPALRATQVIFYSAKYHKWETQALDEAGQVTRHLGKPSPPEEILQAVKEALSAASPAAAIAAPEAFDRTHLRLVTDKLARKVQTLDALNQLGQQLALESDPARLLETLCVQAREILEAEQAVVAISEDGHTLRHFFLSGPDAEAVRRAGTPDPERALLRQLAADERPRRWQALTAEELAAFPAGFRPARHLLWVPIASPTRRYGALYLTNKVNEEEFSVDDEAVAATLGLQLGVAYENARRFEVLQATQAQQRQQAEALAQSQVRLNGIIASAMDAIISIDREQRIVLFNPAAEKLFGAAASEVLGQHINRFIPQRFCPAHARHVENFGRTGTTSRRMGALSTVTGLRANGEEFPIEASISQIVVQGEKLYTVILRDITERVRAEQALRASEEAAHRHVAELERSEAAVRQARDELARANAELERRVEERTAQLVEANTNLQTFANTAAHDLRSPLRAIKSFSNMALEECGSQLDPEGQSYLQRVTQAAEQMERLLRDLLEYCQLSQAEVKLEAIDLGKAVGEALGLLDAEIHAQAAQITVRQTMPLVIGHPATVLLIITNFLSNALKFIPAGVQPHIRIWAEQKQRNGVMDGGLMDKGMEAREGASQSSTNPAIHASLPVVRLWVEDNGIGIEPRDLPKLFGAFQRLHGKRAYPGTGLGLAIVRKGAERMGGRVGVESEPGKGSRFWVELRAAQSKQPTWGHLAAC